MNALAYVGYGFYGASSSTSRANLWSSWGIMETLPGYTPPSSSSRGLFRIFNVFYEFAYHRRLHK